MESVFRDFRVALRMLSRQRIFTLFAVLSVALGIGASTAIFSMVKGVFLGRLPVADPQELISIFTLQDATPGTFFVSYPNYEDFRDRLEVFSGVIAYRPMGVRLTGGATPEMVPGDIVSGNYFDVLGVRAAHGRTFLPDEDQTPGSHPVVVLSHRLWQRQFNSDPAAVGRTLFLNDHPFTVVGVLPASFTSLHVHGAPELFVPMMMHDQVLSGQAREWFPFRDALLFFVVGRLAEGVSFAQAEAATNALFSQLYEAFPKDNEGLSLSILPLTQASIHPNVRQRYVMIGGLLMTLVALLMLIACVNVANMLIARAVDRQGEIALRTALGASRWRITRQLLTESLVLALLGAVVGLAVAVGLRDLLWALRPPVLHDGLEIGLDLQVLGFVLALTVVTGLLFGLAPVLQTRKIDLVPELKQGDRSGAARRRGWGPGGLLVVAQVALSLIAMIGMALFVSSLRNLQQVDPGFQTEQLIVMGLDLGPQQLEAAQGRQFFSTVKERAASVPGVRAVTLGQGRMLTGGGFRSGVVIAGRETDGGGPGPMATVDPVGEDYFETLGMQLVTGRLLDATDRETTRPVAVVNETMAARYWPGESAVGRRFRLDGIEGEREVVGVVRDAAYAGVSDDPQPHVFLPLAQLYSPAMTLYARTDVEPQAVLGPLRREIQALAPDLPLQRVQTMEETLQRALWAPRLGAWLIGLFGVLAVLLSAIGLYGVVAYAVRRSRRQIGIRMAVGARRGEVLVLYLKRGMILVAVGIVLGWLAAFLFAPKVADLLFSIEATNLAIFAGAALLLAAVGLVAIFFPARKAATVNPIEVLRDE